MKLFNKINNNYNNNNNMKKFIISYIKFYCENTTIHCVKYLTENRLHWCERLIWSIFIIFASLCAFYVSLLLSERYNTSPLSTVVESTYYHISEISYPSVSICNNQRIDFTKIDAAIDKFLPKNSTQELINAFRKMLHTFEGLDFGSFDELAPLKQHDVRGLEQIDLDILMKFVVHSCEEMFKNCWWRNKYLPCCKIFSLQKSEYGLCYSFNSGTSLNITNNINRNSDNFPWRSGSIGEWSGLRVVIDTKSDNKEDNAEYISLKPAGVIAIVHHPYEWPNIGHFVPAASTTSIVIKPTAFYTSSDVRRLTPFVRQCVFEDEAKMKIYDIMSLSDIPYLRSNCMAECRQRHMIKYCNCSIDFFYNIGLNNACNITGLMCMTFYNDIFNYEKPPSMNNKYFDENEEGISCPCLPECTRIDYGTEIRPSLVSNSLNESNIVTLDIHYQAATMVLYRTDIVFGWMDLMVAFGGIAGLFLGCSLLSGAEIIYYLTIGLFWQMKRYNEKHNNNINKLYKNDNNLLKFYDKNIIDKKLKHLTNNNIINNKIKTIY